MKTRGTFRLYSDPDNVYDTTKSVWGTSDASGNAKVIYEDGCVAQFDSLTKGDITTGFASVGDILIYPDSRPDVEVELSGYVEIDIKRGPSTKTYKGNVFEFDPDGSFTGLIVVDRDEE